MNSATFVPAASHVTYNFSINFENVGWWGNRSFTVNSAEIQCHNGTTVDISGWLSNGNLDNFTTTTTSQFSVALGPGAHNIVVEVEGSKTYTLTKPVYVTKKEDTNRDKWVDMMDLYLCALFYGSQRTDLLYDWRYDINKDDWVDMMDLYLIALAYGEVT